MQGGNLKFSKNEFSKKIAQIASVLFVISIVGAFILLILILPIIVDVSEYLSELEQYKIKILMHAYDTPRQFDPTSKKYRQFVFHFDQGIVYFKTGKI